MKKIELHNTYSNTKEIFTPQNPKKITMYVCGPTVYDFAHIGNARPAVIFDILFRLLKFKYGEKNVIYTRNITDIDDKINNKAKKSGTSIDKIANTYRNFYTSDIKNLGVLSPTIEPLATEHIDEIIKMIKILVKNNHAYNADGHVIFNVNSFESYGYLSNRKIVNDRAGARVDVASYKKNPADFILWKPSTPDLPGWDSPWGRGRPGWHIECSAMIEKHLGKTIDIHGGGNDLIFPHHENEIAQSMCAHGGQKLANFWIHNGYVTMNKEKMSKSLGNSITINNLLKSYSGETIRYCLLSAHYRQPLDWSSLLLDQAKKTLDRMYNVLLDISISSNPKETIPDDKVLSALFNDLNTPQALSFLSQLCKELKNEKDDEKKSELKSKIISSAKLLGLLQQNPSSWLSTENDSSNSELITKLIIDRNNARKDKDFKKADEIRSKLDELGIILEDNNNQTTWRKNN